MESGGGGREETFPNFLDLSEGLHPLEDNHRNIIHSLVKPSELPLPGVTGLVWETPKRRSPECEFGEATAILKTLKLNPNARAFEFTSPTGSTGSASGNASSGENPQVAESSFPPAPHVQGMLSSVNEKPPLARKLSASSAPFVPCNNIPNIPLPFPSAVSHAQTIHINQLTANINYHGAAQHSAPQPPIMPAAAVITTQVGNSVPMMSQPPVGKVVSSAAVVAGSGLPPPSRGSGGPSLPFTVNGAFPEFINQQHHVYPNPGQMGFHPPTVVYQGPAAINHTMYHYPLVSTAQHNLTPTTYTQQHQQQTVATEQQQTKYTGPPIVSVKEKLEAPDADENPKQYNNSDQYNTGEVSSQYNSYHQTSVNQPQMVGQQPKMGGQAEGLHFINQGYHNTSPNQGQAAADVGNLQYNIVAAASNSKAASIDVSITGNSQYPMNYNQKPYLPPFPLQPQQQQQQSAVHQQQSAVQQHQSAVHQQQSAVYVHQSTVRQQQQPAVHQQQSAVQQQQSAPHQQPQSAVQQQQSADRQPQKNHHQQQQTVVQPQPADYQQPPFASPGTAVVHTHMSPKEIRFNDVDQDEIVGLTSPKSRNEEQQQHCDTSISFGSYDEQMSLEAEPMKEDSWSLHEQNEDNQDESYMKEQTGMDEPMQPQPAVVENKPAAATTWANLLFTKQQAASDKPTARIQPFSTANVGTASPSGATASPVPPVSQDVADTKSREFADFLMKYKLNHHASPLLPAGLSNRSNWCFVNAILQALVACPPFFNMFKAINQQFGVAGLIGTKTAMIQAILNFIKEFSPLEAKTRPLISKVKNRKKEDINVAPCLEPASVYKMLLNLPQKDSFQVVEGRQEDAEEFLTCLLNGLSDEMTEIIKLVPKKERIGGEGVECDDYEATGFVQDEVHNSMEEQEDWKEVSARGKHCVTRRVVSQDTTTKGTPIQNLALGMCRSSLRCESGELSATLQPFFTLQLDIQNPDVKTLDEALLKNFDSEDIEGYKNQKTNQVVKATRSLNLEELPAILILHMKRFVYDAKTGGVQKIMKPVELNPDLEIPKTVLSNETRNKFSQKERSYKLFAVVCHNGREATKGHYVTDIYHSGFSTWLHCDDALVTETAIESVLTPSQTSTPYILFYRRLDTTLRKDKKDLKENTN